MCKYVKRCLLSFYTKSAAWFTSRPYWCHPGRYRGDSTVSAAKLKSNSQELAIEVKF